MAPNLPRLAGSGTYAYGSIVDLADAWERHATQWIPWARTPGQDVFAHQTWPSIRALLPTPGGLALDIGCGEGRVGRELLALGYPVVGIDRSPTLVGAAAHASPKMPIVLGDAAHLPFAEASVDLVVACMTLQDFDDLEGAVGEVSRVLRPGGRVCAALVHPFASAQAPESMHTGTPCFSDDYLHQRPYEDRIERGGLAMTFVSMHRPLSTYVAALTSCGLSIDRLDEIGHRALPWLMTLRAQKSR